jgi:hypothetical protein
VPLINLIYAGNSWIEIQAKGLDFVRLNEAKLPGLGPADSIV